MKNLSVFGCLLFLFTSINFFGQDNSKQLAHKLKSLELSAKDSLGGFDQERFNAEAMSRGFFGKEYNVFMYHMKRAYLDKYYTLQKVFIGSFLNAKPSGTNQVLTAPCNNEGFETSTAGGPYTSLTGWSVAQGQNGFSGPAPGFIYYNTCSVSAMPASSFSYAPVECWIRATPIADANFPGGVPASPLGGTKVVQLNDNIATSGQITRIGQTFPVTTSNALFQYAYAACFDGTGHLCCDQPFLTIQVKNCSNVVLACPNVDVIASGPSCTSGTPGFSTNVSGYLYKNWTVQSIDLTPFIGSCVTIEVIVGDCTGWAHFGYCYFDALCLPLDVTVNNTQFPAGTAATTVAACGVATGTMGAPTGLGPYNWQGPAGSGINNNTNQFITTSTSGNYTLTMMPSGACTPITKTITLLFVPTPTAGMSIASGCNTFTITNTGSPAPTVQSYTFIGASPPAGFTTTASSTVVPFPTPGTYTIQQVVTNTAGCTASVQSVIVPSAPPNPAFSIPSATQCLVGNSFNFNATTATGTHTYNFNPTAGAPSTGNTANYGPVSFLSPGTYTVTHFINAGGCTASSSSVVVVNPKPSLTVVPFNAFCGVSNGSIVINNTSPAGQTVLSFSLNGSAIGSQTATGLAAGTYTLGLTNNFGCTTNTTTSITNTPPITALATTFVNPTCGNSNGSITLGAVTGGSPTFSYSINGGAFTTSPSLTALAAGSYTIVVKDNFGCTFTKTVTLVNQPGPTAITFTTAATTCVGNVGQIGITGITGGTPAFTFSLNGVSSPSVNTGLAAGAYVLTVKDNNGCTFSTTATVNSINGPSSATVAFTNPTCGSSNGSATLTGVTGGVAPYQYSFNGGAFSATTSQAGLAAGPKTVVVKDVNSCTVTVNFNLTNAGTPTVSIAGSTSVNCNNGSTGSFTVNTAGGTPGYNYTLTPGGTSNITGVFNGLTAQTYTVTIKDLAGCTQTITNVISQPPALGLILTPAPVLCNGGSTGSISAGAFGGTPTYSYSINGGVLQSGAGFTGLSVGVHSITVTDSHNCQLTSTTNITQPTPLAVSFTTGLTACVGATGTATIGVNGGTPAYSYSVDGNSSSANATALAAGIHTATVKDNNGCFITGTFNVGVVSGPTLAPVGTTSATCGNANGSATVTSVSGGSSPYTYAFNGNPFSGANNLGGLLASTYTVVVKDVNSCTLSVVYNIGNTGSPAASIASSTNISCFGGNNGGFSVSVSGGVSPFTYTATPGPITNSTGNFSGLTAQAYNVTIKDNVGCITIVTVTLNQPTAVTLSLTSTAVKCNAGNTGSISAAGAGGTGPYTFTLNPSGVTNSTGNFTGLTAGSYSVILKDNKGCSVTTNTIITQPLALVLTTTTTPNYCNGTVSGVTIGVTGGTPAYSYSVDGISTPNTANSLANGTHTVLMKDNNNCSITGTFNITTITGPTTAAIVTQNSSCGAANGSATVTGVTGGTGPFQFSFNGGALASSTVVTGLIASAQSVLIMDANSCTVTIPFTISNTGGPTAAVSSFSNVSCFGGSNGSFTVTPSGGTPGFNYTLTPGNITNGFGTFTGLTAQAYTVVAQDAAGCVTSLTTS
ncbi:MAG: hypothetical protein JWO32_3153, partial [Bacteroidetes bacterium]|nr:hypothetical protein [Bacteroidota bacterium]